MAALRCVHSKHARVAEGRDKNGASNAAASGAYPLGMAAFVMWALARPDVRADGTAPPPDVWELQALVGSALDGVRQSIRGQELLNAQAVAAFCGETQCEACESSVDTAASPIPLLGWRSVANELPAQWDETSDVCGEQWALRSSQALRFISRRRAEPEAAEVLARRPMPKPHVPPLKPIVSSPELPDWPANTPPRPIHISQLYNPGVYSDIQDALGLIADDMAEAELGVRCGAQAAPIPKRRERVWRAAESQPEWARACAWDCTNVNDCVPLRSYTAEDPVTHSLDRAFFVQWGKRLAWTDEDMVQQIAVTGAEGRSDCSLDTVIMGHHGGLRENYLPARASVANDTARGWMTQGRRHLMTVPSRLVPKNVVARKQWKLVLSELISVTKWRVTTDDSIESVAGDIRSRNTAMDRGTWGDMGLPAPQTLGEAVAIMRSTAAAMGIHASAVVLERIALWALDLSDAYREIEVNRSEWWQQGFIHKRRYRLGVDRKSIRAFAEGERKVGVGHRENLRTHDAAQPAGGVEAHARGSRARPGRDPSRLHPGRLSLALGQCIYYSSRCSRNDAAQFEFSTGMRRWQQHDVVLWLQWLWSWCLTEWELRQMPEAGSSLAVSSASGGGWVTFLIRQLPKAAAA